MLNTKILTEIYFWIILRHQPKCQAAKRFVTTGFIVSRTRMRNAPKFAMKVESPKRTGEVVASP
jgi:hypothetical protein